LHNFIIKYYILHKFMKFFMLNDKQRINMADDDDEPIKFLSLVVRSDR
jgi:hypothetical protein